MSQKVCPLDAGSEVPQEVYPGDYFAENDAFVFCYGASFDAGCCSKYHNVDV